MCLWNVYIWGPCQDHVWLTDILKTESTWYKARVYGVSFQGPYKDHVWTMFVLTLLLDELEH